MSWVAVAYGNRLSRFLFLELKNNKTIIMKAQKSPFVTFVLSFFTLKPFWQAPF